MKIQEFMHTEVVTVNRKESIAAANNKMMEKSIKHLPVVDDKGRLVGVITPRDLRRGSIGEMTTMDVPELLWALSRINVAQIMFANPVTIAPHQSAQEAAALMVDKKIACLPVVEDGKLVGIVTERDILIVYGYGHGDRRTARVTRL